MFTDRVHAHGLPKHIHRRPQVTAVLAAAVAGFCSITTIASAESSTYIVASQVVSFSATNTEGASGVLAIGGTRLRAIGGTRLRADESDELQAIGGTFLRAIGGTRLREIDGTADQLAIGGTRLRSDDESSSQAIGGTRLRAIGGTRLRSDESSELAAIGGTRLRAIGGTRLRAEEAESSAHAIGGTRLRAIGGTRLRSDDVHTVQAIGGTRLRAIDGDSSLEAIGGTRLRAIGGTRLRAIGGTRLRAQSEDASTKTFGPSANPGDGPEASSPVAVLVEPGAEIDVFAYGPVTAVSDDQLQIAVVGQPVDLSYGLAGATQLGQMALVAGSANSDTSVIVLSDEWHIPGATNVSVLSRVTSTDTATGTFTLEGGVVVDYSSILSDQPDFYLGVGDKVLVSGIAY